MIKRQMFFWLRFVKQCPIVLFERTPRPFCGQPDVLGITQGRYLIECEIKQSINDFRANLVKGHQAKRSLRPDRFPRQYYFCVPTAIADKVEAELPEYAGLIELNGGGRIFRRNAPVNKSSVRLTIKECAKAAKLMASQYYNSYDALHYYREHEPEYEI